MKNYAAWMPLPIFVTSTFRDMQAERDWLHTHVFPALVERLRERYHFLEAIDLRWGVELTGAGEQQAKELLVLKVVLDEIRRSHILIGLIGDRYGWTPPLEHMRAAAEEAGYSGTLEGRSITALEIEFGVLKSPSQKRRSRFYLREPLPYDEMGALAADYSDLHSEKVGASEAHQRLDALKLWLNGELPDRVRSYRAEWDKERGVVTGLDVWGRMVLDDLWADLEEETCDYVHASPATWQQEEAWVFEQFIATQCPDFIGHEESVGQALDFAATSGGTPWCLVVTGEAGSGKSSWFVRVWQLLRDHRDCLVLAHSVGISARAGSVDAMLRRWIGELAAHLGVPDTEDTLRGREDVEKAFAELLSRAAAHGRVVCLIDAINEFERMPVARRMAWLPELWPVNARLIATAIPGEESEALTARPGVRQMELPALDERQAAAIITTVCGRYHKTLPKAARGELLSKKLPDNRPAAGNPLWLVLALEELALLDADDFASVEREFTGTDDERLSAMLVAVARGFPPEVPSLYDTLLARAERAYGVSWTRGFAELLAVSQTGWRESDLEALLPRVTREAWDTLRFAALRRGFRMHLVQRGASAQWDFSHAQMRAAIEQRYLAGEETRRARHRLLAAHLAALPLNDPLRLSERMFHLIGANDRAGAASHYGDPSLSTGEVSYATRTLSAHAAARGEEGVEWVASLVGALERDMPLRHLGHRFLSDLQDAMADLTDVAARLRVAEAAQRAMEELRRQEPESVDSARDLSASYSKLGDLYFHLGSPPQALEFYRKHLTIAEELRQRMQGSVEEARSLRISYERLGVFHQVELGEPQQALEFQQKALAIGKELWKQAPESDKNAYGVGLSYYRLGELYRELGDLARAQEFCRKHLAIAEDLHQRDPENTEYACDLELSYCRLGNLHNFLGEPLLALNLYQKALAIGEDLQRRLPDSAEVASDLWVTYLELGDLYAALGEPQRALEFYQKAQIIGEDLRRRVPDHAEYARKLSATYSKLGESRLRLGEQREALEFFQKSLALTEELHRLAPESAEYARDHSTSNSHVGMLYHGLGQPQQALEFLQKSLTLREDLWRHAPENAEHARALGLSYERLGVVYIDLGQQQQAMEFFEKSLSLREDLWQRAPESSLYANDLANLYNNLGNLLGELGEPQRGVELYQKAVAVVEALHRRAPENAEYARSLALSSYNLLLGAQHTDSELAASCAKRIVTVVEEMRNAGMFVDEVLDKLYQEALDQFYQKIPQALSKTTTQTSNREHTTSFWKRLFGVKESPKVDITERKLTPESTQSSASNAPPPSAQPIPAIPPQPALPQANLVAADHQPASFNDAARDGDLERVNVLLKGNPELVFSADKLGDTPLHYAGAFGREGVAELLLASKAEAEAEVNAKDNKGRTPLHETAHAGNTELAKLLLLHRADADTKDCDDTTPLHLAANRGHKEVAELLLAKGADINAKEKHGSTPLHLATGLGFRGVVELLLAHKADVNAHSNSGQTALHVAAGLGLKDLAGCLLANHAEVNAREEHHGTPLHLAAFHGHKEVVKLLLASKAEVNAQDNEGRTALHVAANQGDKEAVELLLANQAAINANNDNGQTPLHLAADRGHTKVVELLITSRAYLNAKDCKGMTPLHLAVGRGWRDAAEALLVHHAAVNAEDAQGRTPLHFAAHWGNKDLVDLLLVHHAKLDARDKDGDTPLHAAAMAGRKEVAETLLVNHAQIDARNHGGWTPWDQAAFNDHGDLLELLRRHRSLSQAHSVEAWNQLRQSIRDGNLEQIMSLTKENPTLVVGKDSRSNTLLHWAALDGQRNATEYLLEHGAEVNAKNNEGATPLQIAAQCGHEKVAALLRRHGARE